MHINYVGELSNDAGEGANYETLNNEHATEDKYTL